MFGQNWQMALLKFLHTRLKNAAEEHAQMRCEENCCEFNTIDLLLLSIDIFFWPPSHSFMPHNDPAYLASQIDATTAIYMWNTYVYHTHEWKWNKFSGATLKRRNAPSPYGVEIEFISDVALKCRRFTHSKPARFFSLAAVLVCWGSRNLASRQVAVLDKNEGGKGECLLIQNRFREISDLWDCCFCCVS